MRQTLFRLFNENTIPTGLVAALPFAGQANGTIAVVIIGLVYMVDLPALLQVICEEARTDCSD